MQWSGTPEYRLLCIPQRDICPSSRATCLSNLSCLISNLRRLRSDRFAGVKYSMIIAALSLLAHFDARMVFQLTAAYSARCRERQSEQAFGGVWLRTGD